MENTRVEDSDLESGEYGPVGNIWTFDLEFAQKSSLSKNRIDPVMLKFFATTGNQK